MAALMHCCDVSNYSGPLQPESVIAWRDNNDVGLVIVQAIDPPAGYPQGVTRQQLQACQDAGVTTDAYFYLWTNSDVRADMRRKLLLLEGFRIGRLWLDAEDTAIAPISSRRAAMWAAYQELDLFSANRNLPKAGLYTANWWINGYLGGDASEFKDRPLWLAQYDSVEDTNVVTLPSGWTSCAIKQYAGTSTLAGVGNVDLNVLSAEEEARVNGTVPPEDDCSSCISAVAYMADDLGDKLLAECQRSSVRKTVVRAVVKEMQRVRTQIVGPRP
jgi:Glycosyl hydrolases family 25